MKKMKTQMMIECKNNKIEISRLWLPEILLSIVYCMMQLFVSCSRIPSVLVVRMWMLHRNLKLSTHRMLLADCAALEAMPKIAPTHPRVLAWST